MYHFSAISPVPEGKTSPTKEAVPVRVRQHMPRAGRAGIIYTCYLHEDIDIAARKLSPQTYTKQEKSSDHVWPITRERARSAMKLGEELTGVLATTRVWR